MEKGGKGMRLSNAAVALSFVVLAGCATITRGSEDVLVIKTDPSGAKVETSEGLTCSSTPCVLKVKRRSDFVVTIKKKGCKTHEVLVTNEIANQGGLAMAGNVVFGGIIGAGVDAASGAMRDLVPNPVDVKLNC